MRNGRAIGRTTVLGVLILLVVSLVPNVRWAGATGAASVTVWEWSIPPLHVPYYRTFGRFPNVKESGANLTKVNAALREDVTSDELAYANQAESQESHELSDGAPRSLFKKYPGLYQVLTPFVLTANRELISLLVPITRLFPGGTEGSGWISKTLTVPSGKPVALSEVVTSWMDFTGALSSKSNVVARCGGRKLSQPLIAGIIRAVQTMATPPTHFALSASDLVLGYSNGEVAALSCSRVSIAIPYRVASPYFTRLGRTLMAAAG